MKLGMGRSGFWNRQEKGMCLWGWRREDEDDALIGGRQRSCLDFRAAGRAELCWIMFVNFN